MAEADYKLSIDKCVFFLGILVLWGVTGCGTTPNQSGARPGIRPPLTPAQLSEQIKPPAGTRWREGTALVVLIDTSGSMKQSVPDASGARKPKIDIAKTASRGIVDLVAKYASGQKDQEVQLGIFEFSGRHPAA